MQRLTRALRRLVLRYRHNRSLREIAHIEHNLASLQHQLAIELRRASNLRTDLVFVDIARPPITHARGPHRLDGVDRNAMLRQVELRG